MAAALLGAGATHAWTLDALLQLRLERLMDLQVTAPRSLPSASQHQPALDTTRGKGVRRAV